MAGVKGKSGGARANSGGKRPGAGRKPKAISANQSAVKVEHEPQAHGGALKRSRSAPVAQPEGLDMLTFLQNVALGYTEASTTQVRAAIAAVQYTHTKRGDGGKKDEEAEKARKAAGGKFASRQPPKLIVNNKG